MVDESRSERELHGYTTADANWSVMGEHCFGKCPIVGWKLPFKQATAMLSEFDRPRADDQRSRSIAIFVLVFLLRKYWLVVESEQTRRLRISL